MKTHMKAVLSVMAMISYIPSTVLAQDLVIDNQGQEDNIIIPLKSGTLVTFDNDSNVTVIPDEPVVFETPSDPLVSLFIDQLSVTNQVTVYGKIIGNSNCTDSSNNGSFSNWANGINLESENGFSKNINMTGVDTDVRFSVNCSANSAEVWYINPEAPDVQIPNATVSNFSVVPHASIDNRYYLRFTPGNGAVQCVGSAGTAISAFNTTSFTNGNVFQSSQSYVIPNNATQSWSVSCRSSNNVYVQSNSVTVTYDEPVVTPSNCTTVQTPSSSPMNLIGDQSTYFSHFTSVWPDYLSASPEVDIQLGHYESISFTYVAPETNEYGRTQVNALPANGTYGEPIRSKMSISECPGDFGGTNSVITAPACMQTLYGGFGSVITYPDDTTFEDAHLYCQLEEGKQYYINIIHSENPYSVAPTCLTTRNGGCAVMLTQGN